jgi:DNA-binding GntR family transcriptional regulator
MMTALPVPPSRVEQVYDAIIEQICSGELAAGAALRQELLAERFQISRQPIQQALLLLKAHGLVRDTPNRRGLEVVPVDEKFVVDLYEVRSIIDGLAARRAAERRTDDDITYMEAVLARGVQAVHDRSFAHMITADMEFHQHLIKVADNALLVESAAVLFPNDRRVMAEALRHSGTPQWVWDEHRKIHDAVTAGDADRAEQLAQEHDHHGAELILGAMRGENVESLFAS